MNPSVYLAATGPFNGHRHHSADARIKHSQSQSEISFRPQISCRGLDTLMLESRLQKSRQVKFRPFEFGHIQGNHREHQSNFAKVSSSHLSVRNNAKIDFINRLIKVAVLLLAACLSQTIFTGNLFADELEKVAYNRGPAIVLQQNVVQSTNAVRLLAVAERQLQLGNQDSAFDALLALFATGDADFPVVSQNAGDTSVYDMGIVKLRSSSIQVRSAWSRKVEPFAHIDLQRCQTSAELRLVARKYPFTESGLHANLLLIRNTISRQQFLTASASVKQLQNQYSGISVNFPARTLIAMADQLVEQHSLGQPAAHAIAAEFPIAQNFPSAISSWQPVWTWSENVWKTSQLTGTFAGLSQPNARSALSSNSWQPTLSQDEIFVRTPSKITCLDLLTGEERWSLHTDTISQNTYDKLLSNNSRPLQAGRLIEVLRSSDLGAVTGADDFLFFVDHFRIFESQNNARNMVNLRFNRNPEPLKSSSLKGGRLVAIRLTDPPTVAWTAGIENGFRYATKSQELNEASTASGEDKAEGQPVDSKTPTELAESEFVQDGPFEGHRFLGPPLLFEQSLFVLTTDDENIWLNSLMKGTGRLSWRRPITYQDSLENDPSRRFQTKAEDIGASVVGIYNDTILCLLNTGIVIGTSLPDGRVKWATSLKRTAESEAPLPPSARYLRDISSAPAFPPILHGDRLIWMAADSEDLSCLNASTGSIVWQIPRVSTAVGQADRSKDLLPAGVVNGQLIMTGNRHVRAINLEDGSIAWTAGLNSPNGKAILINDTCWVPILNGSVVPIDAKTGSVGIPITPADAINGSLYLSQSRIIATTPVSVQAYPLFQKSDQAEASLTGDSKQRLAFALQSIQQAVQQPQLQTDFTKTLLQAATNLKDTQQQIIVDHLLKAALANEKLLPTVKAVDGLSLTESQSIRQKLLLNQTPEMAAPSELISLAEEWQVRSDLAASALNQPSSNAFTETTSAGIVRQPSRLQVLSLNRSGQSFQKLATDLFTSRPAAAELALLTQLTTTQTDADRLQILNGLQSLRNQWLDATLANSFGVDRPTPTQQADHFDFKDVKFEVEQDFRFTMLNPINKLTGLSRQPFSIPTPEPWPGRRLFLQDKKMFSVDLNIGTVTESLPLPATPDQVIQGNTPLAPTAPSLLPIVGPSHAGVISIVNQAAPKQLWWKRWERAPYDNTPLKSGPITPSGIIYATNHRISCLHPLTGDTLWRRDFSAGSTESIFSRQVGFAADTEHLIALGPGYRSGTVFRMDDGRKIASFAYDVPEGIIPIISGSRMLYPDQKHLKLIDLSTTKDLLHDLSIEVLPDSAAPLLDTSRAVIMTDNQEIAVLDLQTARIDFKVKLSPEIQRQRTASFQVFENNGRMMILFRQWNGRNRELSATSVIGDRRLTSGRLVSVHPKTGEQWSIQIPSTVMMEIAGDPAPLLVLWSRQSHRNGISQGFDQRNYSPNEKEDNLLLRVIDERTGREVFRTEDLGWGNPLRCFHDSESQTITIETDASEIQLRYTASNSDPE